MMSFLQDLEGGVRQRRNIVAATIISLFLHVFFFGIAWAVRNDDPIVNPVRKKVTRVKLVKFGDPERPKHYMPRLEAPPPPVENTTKIKSPLAEKKDEKAKPKTKPKKQARLDEDLLTDDQRRALMMQALAKVRTQSKNRGSEDGVLGGEVTEKEAEILTDRYIGRIAMAFEEHFQVPAIIPPAELENLKVQIYFQINGEGRIIRHELRKSSGNVHFDEAALAAALRTRNVPKPDELILQRLVRTGFVIEFEPNR